MEGLEREGVAGAASPVGEEAGSPTAAGAGARARPAGEEPMKGFGCGDLSWNADASVSSL